MRRRSTHHVSEITAIGGEFVIGSFIGAVFLVIQWMQARQYIQEQIDWNRVGNDTMAWFQSLSAQASSSHIFGTLGIPATSGLAIGLVAGLAKSCGT